MHYFIILYKSLICQNVSMTPDVPVFVIVLLYVRFWWPWPDLRKHWARDHNPWNSYFGTSNHLGLIWKKRHLIWYICTFRTLDIIISTFRRCENFQNWTIIVRSGYELEMKRVFTSCWNIQNTENSSNQKDITIQIKK